MGNHNNENSDEKNDIKKIYFLEKNENQNNVSPENINNNQINNINQTEDSKTKDKTKPYIKEKNNKNEKEGSPNVSKEKKIIDNNNAHKLIKFGRKISQKLIIHNEYSTYKLIEKIKFYFFDFMMDFIHKHSIKKNFKLKKLCWCYIALNRENERLWKTKISDILKEGDINPIFKRSNKYQNQKIINKIYSEKKEINVIKILELTFEELFIIFRRKLNDPEDMKRLEEMKDKLEGLDILEFNNKYNDIEYYCEKFRMEMDNKYIEAFKLACLKYGKKNQKIMRRK